MVKAKKEESNTNVPALVVTPEKAPVVSGNFEQIEAYLQKWKKQVSKMEITEDNIEQVRLIKKEAVAYRNSLTKIQNDIKRTYFNDPKAVFDAKMGQLLGVVSEVENAADSILEIEEKQRIADINQVLDNYKTKFQEQYNLDEGRLARIEYRKSYYNKSDMLIDGKKVSPELAAKRDLEQQFKDLKKQQDAYAANVRLITATCKEDQRLNLQHYIDRLESDEVSVIIESIVAEKQRLRDLDTQGTTSSTGSETEDADYEVVDGGDGGEDLKTVVLGAPSTIDFSSDFEGKKKSMDVRIEYNVDQGDALSELFKMLKGYGIKIKKLEKEVVF